MSTTTRMLTLAAAVLLSLPVAAQASPNPPVSTFVYTANMEPLGASERTPMPAGDFHSDLAFWGDRAYQGTYEGFRIIDISNPEDPQSILDYDDCKGNQGDLIVWDNILIRSWNSPAAPSTAVPPVLPSCDGESVQVGFEGLHIFNIANPADPDLIASVNVPGCGSHTATGFPDPANNRLLVYNNPSSSAPPQCAGFTIVAIPLNNPANPQNLGQFNTGRSCHDTAVILGDAMRVACAGGDGLTVFSIGGAGGGTFTAPKLLWTKSISGVTIGHAVSFSQDGSIVAFGHEPGGGTAAECEATDEPIKKTLFFFNALDGTELGRWILPRPQTAQENCTIHNFNTVPTESRNILVSGNYQAGIAIVDFTNPAQPQEIAYADPAPLNPNQLQTGGDWSTYWYNGHIYESDITRGLITWRLNDPAVAGAETFGHSNPQTQESTIAFTGVIPPTAKCKGKPITIFGSSGNDVLNGSAAADIISTGEGDDRLIGLDGNDVLCGGPGNDLLKGGAGNDILLGQAGKDVGKGGKGKDLFKGGPGRDTGSGFEKGKA